MRVEARPAWLWRGPPPPHPPPAGRGSTCNSPPSQRKDYLVTISLQATAMMGHWPVDNQHVCEFQHGSTMIYVFYDDANPMQQRLAMAQASIDEAFADVEAALVYAKGVYSITHPEFWKQAHRIELRQRPLIVFGVYYHLDTPSPEYLISWSPNFRPEEGTDYSEDWIEEVVRVEVPRDRVFISVGRTESGEFRQVERPRA